MQAEVIPSVVGEADPNLHENGVVIFLVDYVLKTVHKDKEMRIMRAIYR